MPAPRPTVTVFLGLGTNLGDREENLDKAIKSLPEQIEVVRESPRYESKPVGPQDQACFLNSVLEVRTALAPKMLLKKLKLLETELGRIELYRWGPRVIDLDILLYGETQIRSPALRVPHPGLSERRFVLKPLADLAPELSVPGQGTTVRELLEALKTPVDEVWPAPA